MAYHVITLKVKHLGFCCQYGYSIAVQHLSTSEIAKELGVHLRTARTWKAKVRDGKISCACTSTCLKDCTPGTVPRK